MVTIAPSPSGQPVQQYQQSAADQSGGAEARRAAARALSRPVLQRKPDTARRPVARYRDGETGQISGLVRGPAGY